MEALGHLPIIFIMAWTIPSSAVTCRRCFYSSMFQRKVIQMGGVYPDYELAWCAGIIDGEGSIMLNKGKSSMTYPTVSVSSTSVEILQKLKDLFGGCLVSKKTYENHHKQSYSWSLVYNKALEFLKVVRPFLVEKEKIRRADLLLSKYKSLTKRNGRYTKEELKARRALDEEFHNPNPSSS